MAKMGYFASIRWLANNDDTDWVFDEDPCPSVTASLIADIFDVSIEKVTKNLRNELNKEEV